MNVGFLIVSIVTFMILYIGHGQQGLYTFLLPRSGENILIPVFLFQVIWFYTGINAILKRGHEIQKMEPIILTRLQRKRIRLLGIMMRSAVSMGLTTVIVFALPVFVRIFVLKDLWIVLLLTFVTWMLWGLISTLLLWLRVGYRVTGILLFVLFGVSHYIGVLYPNWMLPSFYTLQMSVQPMLAVFQKVVAIIILIIGTGFTLRKYEGWGVSKYD